MVYRACTFLAFWGNTKLSEWFYQFPFSGAVYECQVVQIFLVGFVIFAHPGCKMESYYGFNLTSSGY